MYNVHTEGERPIYNNVSIVQGMLVDGAMFVNCSLWAGMTIKDAILVDCELGEDIVLDNCMCSYSDPGKTILLNGVTFGDDTVVKMTVRTAMFLRCKFNGTSTILNPQGKSYIILESCVVPPTMQMKVGNMIL